METAFCLTNLFRQYEHRTVRTYADIKQSVRNPHIEARKNRKIGGSEGSRF